MYGLIWLTDLRTKLGRIDLFIMLTSALCHDLDHPGYNNVYQVTSSSVPKTQNQFGFACFLSVCEVFFPLTQINAQTDLALRYNDISPLENHHCATAFGILSKVPVALHYDFEEKSSLTDTNVCLIPKSTQKFCKYALLRCELSPITARVQHIKKPDLRAVQTNTRRHDQVRQGALCGTSLKSDSQYIPSSCLFILLKIHFQMYFGN